MVVLNNFIKDFNKIIPNKKLVKKNGFSEPFIERLILNEFTLLKKSENNITENDSLLYFLSNYETENLTINKLFFSDSLQEIENYTIICGFEGGFLGRKKNKDEIMIIYSDDIENINEIFCENEFQFFNLLLIFSEYSCLIYEGKIQFSDEEIRNDFLNRCNSIYPLCDFDYFL